MTNITIKGLRKAAGMTQKELADAIGIDRSSIGKYETGTQPSSEVLMKLASFFNVSMDYLYGISEEDIFRAKDQAEVRVLRLFRKTDRLPLEKRMEIADYIGATIDMYLKALGLDSRGLADVGRPYSSGRLRLYAPPGKPHPVAR